MCVVFSGRKIYRLRKIFAIVDRVIVSVDYTNIRNDGAYHVLDNYYYKNKKNNMQLLVDDTDTKSLENNLWI